MRATITPSDRTRFSDLRAMLEQRRQVSPEDLAWYESNRQAMREISHAAMRKSCRWEDYKLSGRMRRQAREAMA